MYCGAIYRAVEVSVIRASYGLSIVCEKNNRYTLTLE